MKNSLDLDFDDSLMVKTALEMFLEAKNAVVLGIQFREPLRTELIKSSLMKLENLSMLTYFNKQELTIMVMALHYLLNCSQTAQTEELNDEEILSLADRLSALAGADKMHLN